MSIDLKLSPAEIAFAIDSIRNQAASLIDKLTEAGSSLMDQMEADDQPPAVEQDKYVQNLESLVRELTQENASLANKKVAPKVAKKRGRPAKEKAPWGYKKDGTPKKRPGRPVGDF